MTGAGAFIAVDWGTTNRRAWRVERDGSVAGELRDDRGVATLLPADYPAEVDRLRARLGDLPVLAAGMVGSTRGWVDAPYVPAPATLADLAGRLTQAGDRVRVVPGVATVADDRPDVMRGEEVQLLGAAAAGLVPADALLAQPGTHAKWVWMEGGRIARFTTALTGELFALVRTHGVLAEMLAGDVVAGDAFRAGVRRAAATPDLLGQLFGVRAAVLLGRLPRADAASVASGLMIGADVAARSVATAGTVHLLAEGPLATLYADAVDTLGGASTTIDSTAAFLAGITRLEELSR